jgi:hypothetical protein
MDNTTRRRRPQGPRRSGRRQGQALKDAQLDTWAPDSSQVPQIMRALTKESRIFRKVLGNVGNIPTGVTGFLGVVPVAGSNAVTSCPSWSTISLTALEYRVIGMECDFFPVVNTATSYATPPPAMILTCDYSSGLAPSTVGAVLEGPRAKMFNGFRPFRLAASAKGFPPAMLWTATNASITSANTYGFVIADQGAIPAGPISQNVLRFTVRYIVEFRSLD